MYSIAYVVPYFGKFPKGFQFWLLSCKCNPSIDLNDVVSNSEMYIESCIKYRYKLSTKQRVEQFLEVKK